MLLGLAAGDALDAGADATEFPFDLLVAAIDVIDAVDVGAVFGDEAGENDSGAGAQIGCRDGRAAERTRAAA